MSGNSFRISSPRDSPSGLGWAGDTLMITKSYGEPTWRVAR